MRGNRLTGLIPIVALLLAVSLYADTPILPASDTHVISVLADSDATVPLGPPTTVTRGGVTAQVRAIQRTQVANGSDVVANRVIVGFQPGVGDTDRNAVHQQVARAIPGVNPTPLKAVGDSAQYVDVTGASSLDAVIQAYQSDSRVRYAEPDYLVHAADMPNDPYVSNQYALRVIQAPGAWNVTHGLASVKIAILDCGIYEAHPDITGKVIARQDFTGSAYGTDDRCNHGTLVAGIAGANTNNGTGVAGVGYNTDLMNGKVLLEQFDSAGHLIGANGSSTWIASGIHWAADNGAKVINLSLGSVFTPTSGSGATCSQTFQDAVTYATTHNVTVIAAAGNDGTTELFQPASCAGVVSVASTDQNDVRSSFSNYGPWVSVAAPGSAILGPINPTLPENNGQAYGSGDGTSFSAPNVAGLAGLLWATRWNTNAQTVSSRILTTADPIAGQTGVAWQTGRINAAKAVAGPPPAVTSISPSSLPAGSGSFSLTVTGTGFTAGAAVSWNGAARATSVTSSAQAVATILASDLATTGSASVSITNPDGSASPTGVTFTITTSPPRPTAISPTSGGRGGGATVTIGGNYFQAGARVTIGGGAAAVQSVTATTITATTPAHLPGTVDIVVTNPDGQTGTLASGYTYAPDPAPQPGGLTPSSGSARGGTSVTISGASFQAGARVTFGGAAASVQSLTDTTIIVVTPAHAAGTVDVVVTNPDGQTGTLAGAYTFTVDPEPTSRVGPPPVAGTPAPMPPSRPGTNTGAGVHGTPAPMPLQLR